MFASIENSTAGALDRVHTDGSMHRKGYVTHPGNVCGLGNSEHSPEVS